MLRLWRIASYHMTVVKGTWCHEQLGHRSFELVLLLAFSYFANYFDSLKL